MGKRIEPHEQENFILQLDERLKAVEKSLGLIQEIAVEAADRVAEITDEQNRQDAANQALSEQVAVLETTLAKIKSKPRTEKPVELKEE